MKKLLLFSEIFPPQTGGSGRWFWEIYRRLPGEKVAIATRDFPGHEEFDQTHDLSITRIPISFRSWGIVKPASMRNYASIARDLLRVVRRVRPNIVHCGRCLPEGLIALGTGIWTRVPYVCYVHGEEVSTAARSRELKFLAQRALNGAHKIIANSENTKRMLCDCWGLPGSKIYVLYPGVDTEQFVPAARDDKWRDRMGWSGRKVILTVGRLQRRKGHDQLIRALPRIRQTVPNVLYAILGDGGERPKLDALVAELGVGDLVQFAGEVSDEEMVRSYQQCDLFALPNRQIGGDIEGFGIVLLEAQACGKPVIAGDSGGTSETMDIPSTGRVVCCDGPEPLGSTIAEMLSRPEELEAMGKRARQWTVDRFDWKVLSKEAEELFASL